MTKKEEVVCTLEIIRQPDGSLVLRLVPEKSGKKNG